jgi:hypothetical protein
VGAYFAGLVVTALPIYDRDVLLLLPRLALALGLGTGRPVGSAQQLGTRALAASRWPVVSPAGQWSGRLTGVALAATLVLGSWPGMVAAIEGAINVGPRTGVAQFG